MRKRISPRTAAVLAAAAGIVLGSLFCNGPGQEWLSELGIFSSSYGEWLTGGEWEMRGRFLKLLALRGVPVLLILLAGRGRSFLMAGIWFLYSFLTAIFWSACLLFYGIRGIFFFLAALFPHWLLYGMALGMLTGIWAADWYRWKRSLPVLLSLLILGAAAETCIHPVIAGWLLSVI